MKIGITVPNHWGVADVHDVLSLGSHAERLGFDSVWTMDHLLNVGRVRERLDDRPYWHPLAILSALSCTTSRVTLGTSVMVLPYHDPVGLAKYAATLDWMSRGRLVLGVGVGALREEFDALGIPMRRRGAMTDESIAVMKELWTRDEPSFHGGRFRFQDLTFSPRPAQQPHMPLWIGGGSDAAIARAARAGDGWHPANPSPESFESGAAKLAQLAAAHGRDPKAIELSIRLDVDTQDPPQQRAMERLMERLVDYRARGLEHVVLALTSGDVAQLTRWMTALAATLIPRLAGNTT